MPRTKEDYVEDVKALAKARHLDELARVSREAYLNGSLTLQEIETLVKENK